MQHAKYEVLVCVNGRAVKEYSHQEKTFIEGRPETTYSLKLKNHSGLKVMAIISVDGVNVISGKPTGTEDAGYIVDAHGTIDIKGFRKDMSSVGAFKFCSKSKSYCNSTGLKGNNGVIGVRFIEEFTYPTITYNATSDMYWTSGCIDYAGDYTCVSNERGYNTVQTYFTGTSDLLNHPEPEPSFSVGTTWGKEIKDKCCEEEFKPGKMVAELELFYGTKTDLKKMGVSLEKKPKVAFPKAFGPFAKPPKGWRG